MTDDLCSIEYTTSRAMFDRIQPRTLVWLDELRKRPFPAELYPGADLARVAEARERRRRIASVIVYEADHRPAHEVLEFFSETVGSMGDDPHVRDYFDSIANFARIDAQTLRLSGKLPLALRVLKSIPRDSTHYPDALLDRAGIAQRLGDRGEEQRCLRALREEYPRTFAGTCLQALLAEEDSHLQDAERSWQTAIALRPDSEYSHAHLAACLKRLGRRDDARAECRKALDLDPSNALAKQILQEIGN
jgi:tetratricopeptide (TPR) repeat protein